MKPPLLWCLRVLGLALALPAWADQEAAPDPAAEVARLLPEVADGLAQVRQLDRPPLQPLVFSGAEAPGRARELVDLYFGADLSEDTCRRLETAWTFLGLLPPGTSLRSSLVDGLTEECAGYYQFRSGQMYIRADLVPTVRKQLRSDLAKSLAAATALKEQGRLVQQLARLDAVAALEKTHGYLEVRRVLFQQLMHAAQDRRWPLGTLYRSDSSDMALALRALVEGDNQAASAAFVAGAKDAALLGDLAAGYDQLALKEDRQSPPRFVRQLLAFPRCDGARFVTAVKKAGGGKWDKVNGCYDQAAPPLTTHEILHPEHHGNSKELFLAIQVGDRDRPAEQPWEPVWNDSLGEFGIRCLLRATNVRGRPHAVLNPVEADQVAAGWRGDRYQVWKDHQGRLLLAWVTTWQDRRAATRFFDAQARRLGWRYPGAKVVKDEAQNYRLVYDGRTSFVHTTGADATQVLVIEEVPLAAAAALEQRLAQARLAPLLQAKRANSGNYACPVHDARRADYPGTCPVCGRPRVARGR